MSAEDVELCIESLDGNAQPPVVYLTPGEQLGPIHIGAQGKWQVTGEGVADRHAFIFFDGNRLFIQTAEGVTPVIVDGHEVPTEWVPIDAPCTIELGSSRLHFGPTEMLDQDADVDMDMSADELANAIADVDQGASSTAVPDSTRILEMDDVMESVRRHRAKSGQSVNVQKLPGLWMPTPAKGIKLPRPGTPPGSAPNLGNDDMDPTAHFASRVDVEGPTAVAIRGGSETPPSMPTPTPYSVPSSFGSQPGFDAAGFDAAPLSSPSGAGAPAPLPMAGPPPTDAPVELIDPSIGASATAAPQPSRWKRMSFPAKATVFLFPFMIGSVVVIFTDLGVPKPQATNTTTTASTAAPTADGPPAGSTEPGESETDPDVVDGDVGGGEPVDLDVDAGVDGADAAAPIAVAQSSAPAPKRTKRRRRGRNKRKTLQRKAVDAVARASFEEAAEHYEELAKQFPDNQAYAAAAAITRARARGK